MCTRDRARERMRALRTVPEKITSKKVGFLRLNLPCHLTMQTKTCTEITQTDYAITFWYHGANLLTGTMLLNT